jgi:hypothetical protein
MIRAYRGDSPERQNERWVQELIRSHRQEQAEEEGQLYCFLCGRPITRVEERIEVQGAHEHTFSNPAGYVFDIACFASASGCASAGEPTELYSWFDGYTWSYAVCGGCRAHLGWLYQGTVDPADRFFGLIRDRLVSSRESFPSLS